MAATKTRHTITPNELRALIVAYRDAVEAVSFASGRDADMPGNGDELLAAQRAASTELNDVLNRITTITLRPK